MHWPLSTSQRPLASTGRPSAQASSATIDRLSKYDGMISRSAAASASNLSWSDRKPEVVDAVVLRDRHHRACRSARRSRPRGNVARVALEVVEQLAAALVLVDPADVDRERPVDARSCRRNRAGSVRAGTSEPTPTTTPGTSALPAAAWIIARSSCELYMIAAHAAEDRPEDRQADRRIALGRRHQHRLARRARRAPCHAW